MSFNNNGQPTMTSRKLFAIILAFIMQFTFAGFLYSYSEYFKLLTIDFDSSYSFFGFVGTSVAFFSNAVGPTVAPLLEMFHYSVLIIIFGILIGASFALSSVDEFAWEFFLSYSVLFGISAGLINSLSITLLVDELDEEDMGIGFASSQLGTGFGYITISCIAAYFTVANDAITWRVLFRYFALMTVPLVFIGLTACCVMKGTRRKKRRSLDTIGDESSSLLDSNASGGQALVGKDVCGWELFLSGSDHRSKYLFISHILQFFMQAIPIKFSIIYATESITDTNVYYYVPLCMGTATIVSRFMFNYLSNGVISAFTAVKIIQWGCICSAVALSVVPMTSTAAVLSSLSAYALFNSQFPLVMLRTREILGPNNYTENFGVQVFGVGLGYLGGGVLAGYIYDVTSSLPWVFSSVAVFYFASFVFDFFALDDTP